MITSWKFWTALQHPPALHPLFQRNAGLEYQIRWPAVTIPRVGQWTEMVLLVLLAFVLLANPAIAFVIILFVPFSFAAVIVALPLLFPLLTSVVCAFWAAVMGGEVAREREKGTFELLCLLPDGVLGANWAICSGTVHRSSLFDVMYLIARALALFGVIMLGLSIIITLGIYLGQRLDAGNERVLEAMRTLMDILALLVAYHLHYVQSVALTALIGMWVPLHFSRPVEVRILAPVAFLGAQAITYALAYVLGAALLPTLLSTFYTDMSPLWVFLPPLLSLGVFLLVRETCIALVWHFLQRSLNTHPSELAILASAA